MAELSADQGMRKSCLNGLRVGLRALAATWVATASVGSVGLLCPDVSSTLFAQSAPFDVLLRGGTIVDGTGGKPYVGDVGISGAHIARIGDLATARATVELDVRGLIVAPGFINIHSHAVPAALKSAANMLTQGVTTEIVNPDGGGPIDLAAQRAAFVASGLAVNAGAYIGFNSTWASVVGATDTRPTPAMIDSMRRIIERGLSAGAFGVSSGLDYKPAYYATVDEVVAVIEPTRSWRTNFANHDRVTPETNFSSRVGMNETMAIGERTGLVPVFTHMKVQGREQGTSTHVLSWMHQNIAAGRYVTADVYPYLAGQTSLAALIIPGWAQDGGRAQMLTRFRDPVLRARIVKEANDALDARFGGAKGVYLFESKRELADVMRDMNVASAAEAVVRILEVESPGAILRFGAEADVMALLADPYTSIACDCGAIDPASGIRGGHPRYFGTYPRVLGHYVREQRALTWEAAVRKMSALPAATVGLVDRGVLAVGMVADISVFDSATIADRATYELPNETSVGVRHVLVNGTFALTDGAPTGARAGQALVRSAHEPSRAMAVAGGSSGAAAARRRITANGTVTSNGSSLRIALDATQSGGARQPAGALRVSDPVSGVSIVSTTMGNLQTSANWASLTGRARVGRDGIERAFTVIVDRGDPNAKGSTTIIVRIDGRSSIVGTLADPSRK